MNIKSAHLLTALAGRIVRQVGRNFRPNISADFAEIFGRIFGFGHTLEMLQIAFVREFSLNLNSLSRH